METISCDLLADDALRQLPDVPNVIYMAGNKFGTTGKEYFTWEMNAYLPGRVAEKYKGLRIVVFSSGNIYPFSPVIGRCGHVKRSNCSKRSRACVQRERLRRQGLMSGTWCLNPHEVLSPGQADEIERMYQDYPHLHDDEFVRQNLAKWLA